jgi:hypothetical protein
VGFDVTDELLLISSIRQILKKNWSATSLRLRLCHIFFEFGVSMKLVRHIRMYLNEICKHLSDTFYSNVLKEGDVFYHNYFPNLQ